MREFLQTLVEDLFGSNKKRKKRCKNKKKSRSNDSE